MTQTAGRTERQIQDIALADGRHLRVDGTYNLRDVGGYPTQAGGSVAWRTLFRSDSLQRLDSQGVAGLAALDMHTIVDLALAEPMQRRSLLGTGSGDGRLDALRVPRSASRQLWAFVG